MFASRVAAATSRSRTTTTALSRRWLTNNQHHNKDTVVASATKEAKTAATTATEHASKEEAKKGWWHSAPLWGGLGAAAGWGMSASAIYDATTQGPELISLTMTPVLIVYSALFARWAMVIVPTNPVLSACHATNVVAQLNQLRRALEYKMDNGMEDEVKEIGQKAAMGGAALVGSIFAGPTMRSALANADLGAISKFGASEAGPFTVHFWAPMSKWLISGASFMDLNRPTDKISLPQYTALTLTGFFFSRYSLLVRPINYTLCSVNIALFGSSAWHLSRKVNADFLQIGTFGMPPAETDAPLPAKQE